MRADLASAFRDFPVKVSKEQFPSVLDGIAGVSPNSATQNAPLDTLFGGRENRAFACAISCRDNRFAQAAAVARSAPPVRGGGARDGHRERQDGPRTLGLPNAVPPSHYCAL